jgi:hypothetical protein
MTEYGFMVQSIEVKPEMDDADAAQVGKSVAMQLNQMVQRAARGLSLKGGGWEIASHTITRVGRHMVVSFLIKRQAPAS